VVDFILSPSILAADFSCLGQQIESINNSKAPYIHIDVMDGSFVPSISFGMPVIKSIRKMTNKVFDVHLMIDEPARYIKDFKEAGADMITVHQESCKHLHRTIAMIKDEGLKVGVALNPATSLDTIKYILDDVDMVLIMSVNPGFGGQKYIPFIDEKIRALKEIIDKKDKKIDIQVDGGITLDNITRVVKAGVNVVVCGTAVFKGDINKNIEDIYSKIENM